MFVDEREGGLQSLPSNRVRVRWPESNQKSTQKSTQKKCSKIKVLKKVLKKALKKST